MNITELTFYTSHLEQQIEFYTQLLGVKLKDRSATSARLQFGSTVLALKAATDSTPYHFAINIPSNKIHEAREWCKERVPLLPFNDKDIIDFEAWDAKAIYFYDADKNIVEFIARNTLEHHETASFNSNQLLSISEVGMPVESIDVAFSSISTKVKLPIYSGDFSRFCAIGDENGLIICIDKTIKKWFPNDDDAPSSPFELQFEENGTDYELSFRNEEALVLKTLDTCT